MYWNHCKKKKFPIDNSFSKRDQIRIFLRLATFTEQILNGKLPFLSLNFLVCKLYKNGIISTKLACHVCDKHASLKPVRFKKLLTRTFWEIWISFPGLELYNKPFDLTNSNNKGHGNVVIEPCSGISIATFKQILYISKKGIINHHCSKTNILYLPEIHMYVCARNRG